MRVDNLLRKILTGIRKLGQEPLMSGDVQLAMFQNFKSNFLYTGPIGNLGDDKAVASMYTSL
jgi:hypothetical protein